MAPLWCWRPRNRPCRLYDRTFLRIIGAIFKFLQIFKAKLAFATVRIKALAEMLITSKLVFTPIPWFSLKTCAHPQ